MKSLGPELEGIVREEARKAEAVLLPAILRDAAPTNWEQHGGKVIVLPAADQKAYLETVSGAITDVLDTPQLKEDYQALKAAGQKYAK